MLFDELQEVYFDFPFPAFHIMPSIALLVAHLLSEQTDNDLVRKHKGFYYHLFCFYIPVNTLAFSVWVGHTPQIFAVIFLGTNFPLLVHFFLSFYCKNVHKWYYINLCSMLNLNFLLFILWWWLWRIQGQAQYPWFVYPLYLSGISPLAALTR